MDLYLYARVLWRFRLLVLAGLALAIALATLSVLRIGPDGVSYRDSRLWAADMKIAVTQRGCPECRLYAQYSSRGSDDFDARLAGTTGHRSGAARDACPLLRDS